MSFPLAPCFFSWKQVFFNEENGRGLFLFAGSGCAGRFRSGTYAVSVHIIRKIVGRHSAGAVRAKPFRRANCFRLQTLSSKGCNNEPTYLLRTTPNSKRCPAGENRPHGPSIGSREGTGLENSLRQAKRTSAHFFR